MPVNAPATRQSRRRPAGVLELGRYLELDAAGKAAALAAGWLPPMAGADPVLELDQADALEAIAADGPVRDVADYGKRLERAIAAGVDLRAARTALEPERRNVRTAELRALDDSEADAPGTFEAIVAVFGNVDSYGDRMMPGSFTQTLKAPPEGRGYPAQVWSHEWGIVPIGPTLVAREVAADELEHFGQHPAGLYIKARLLVDTAAAEDHPVARQVWAAMRAIGGDGLPALREFSFGYRTTHATFVEEPDEPNAWFGEVREIHGVELYETGPTLVGANSATRLLNVKSHAERHLKAHRRDPGHPADPATRERELEGRKSITEALMRRPTPGGIRT